MEAKKRRLDGAPPRRTVASSPSQKTRASDAIGCEEDTSAILKTCLSKITELQGEVAALNSKVERLEGTVSELQERNTSLEERGAYLERATSALVRLQDDFHFPINKIGPYSSEVAPGTDWPQLVALMDTEAYDMCNRELKLETSICPATSDQILHNEDLMPAWTRYADALRLSKIHMINIDNVEFSAPALRKLTFALGNKKLFSLSWTRSSCLDVNAGIDFVASAARRLDADGNQKHFRPHFSWSNCAIPDLDAANRLCDALSSVKRVNFIDSCGESQIIGATILGSLINADKRIVELSLINNRVTGLDRGHATSLADNTWLERLDLSHNHLNDEDAAVIATGLRQNRKLKWLSIWDNNNFSDDGFVSLCSAIYSPNVQELVECNHSCVVEWDVSAHPPETFATRLMHYHNGFLYDDPPEEMSNLRHKIFVSFSEHNKLNSRTGVLTGLNSIKLAPLAIERVIKCEKNTVSRAYLQELNAECPGHDATVNYIDLVPVLSVVFELLKEWKMPELLQHK